MTGFRWQEKKDKYIIKKKEQTINLLNGRYVDYDSQKARIYYTSAVSKGCQEAIDHLRDIKLQEQSAPRLREEAKARAASEQNNPPIKGNFYQHTWDCECAFNHQSRTKEPCCFCSNRSLREGDCTDSAGRH